MKPFPAAAAALLTLAALCTCVPASRELLQDGSSPFLPDPFPPGAPSSPGSSCASFPEEVRWGCCAAKNQEGDDACPPECRLAPEGGAREECCALKAEAGAQDPACTAAPSVSPPLPLPSPPGPSPTSPSPSPPQPPVGTTCASRPLDSQWSCCVERNQDDPTCPPPCFLAPAGAEREACCALKAPGTDAACVGPPSLQSPSPTPPSPSPSPPIPPPGQFCSSRPPADYLPCCIEGIRQGRNDPTCPPPLCGRVPLTQRDFKVCCSLKFPGQDPTCPRPPPPRPTTCGSLGTPAEYLACCVNKSFLNIADATCPLPNCGIFLPNDPGNFAVCCSIKPAGSDPACPAPTPVTVPVKCLPEPPALEVLEFIFNNATTFLNNNTDLPTIREIGNYGMQQMIAYFNTTGIDANLQVE